MRGEFSGVKEEIIRGIFEPFVDEMSDAEFLDEEIWEDLFREAIPAPTAPEAPTYTAFNDDGQIYLEGDIQARDAYEAASAAYQDRLEAHNDASNRADLAWQYIVTFFEDPATTERQIVKALEDAFDAVEDYGGGNLANAYYQIVERFLEKYSLRYDLRRPFSLHPTLSGVFARLMRDLRDTTLQDAALAALMHDFEESVRDLKEDQSPRRVKQCIAAQFNLLEALLRLHPNTNGNTFGAMCNETGGWPHEAVKEAAQRLYRFASDYPGIRHGGTPANQLREVDMRDMVAMTVALAGFTPYFSDLLNADKIYSD